MPALLYRLTLFLLLPLLFAAFPLHAQDEPQSAITAALADFAALDSYRFVGETRLNQENTFAVASGRIETIQQLSGVVTGSSVEALFTVSQTISGEGEPIAWGVTVDRVAMDETIYLRFRDLLLPPTLASEAFPLPQDWFIPEPLPTDLGSLSAAQLGLASFIDGYRAAPVIPPILGYPLDDQTVRSIEQLPDEDLDGRAVRVYEVGFNAFGLYIAHTRDEWNATFLRFETSGIDIARFFVEGGVQVRGRYWIDADGALAQVEQQIRLEVRPGTLPDQADYGFSNDTRLRMSFSDFNVPVEIAAPVLE